MDQQISTTSKSDVLILALARHDGLYSSTAWSLAKAFSSQGRVIYVDNPFTLADVLKGKKKEQIRKRYYLGLFRKKKVLQPNPALKLLVLVPPVTLPVNWLPNGRLYRVLSAFNNWLLKKAVQEVLEKNNWNSYLYINSFNPFYGKEGDFTPSPSYYIYQTVDEISHSNYIGKHGPTLEMEAMQLADSVVATSRQLQKKAATVAKNAVYIPNAADVALFKLAMENNLAVPEELKNEHRKIACYIGHIDKRLDYTLLVSVARLQPDMLFLMVGPVSGTEVESSGFAQLPNVKFTGKKELQELPAYLQQAHLAIIPFKCNPLTASIYPLKINEYLAAGKGVIATPFSDDIRDFAEQIELATTPEEFSKAIGQIIRSDKKQLQQERMETATNNSWEARVASFWHIFDTARENGRLKKKHTAYEEAVK